MMIYLNKSFTQSLHTYQVIDDRSSTRPYNFENN